MLSNFKTIVVVLFAMIVVDEIDKARKAAELARLKEVLNAPLAY